MVVGAGVLTAWCVTSPSLWLRSDDVMFPVARESGFVLLLW